MTLPRNFQFSATSLQDYVDCSRRFQLRYVLQVAWPAPEAEPISEQEHHGRLARDFHRLVHQHLLGLPTGILSASVHDPDLERWWRAYLAYVPTFGNARILPEVGLSTPLAGYRVMAQYDAIIVSHQHSAEQHTGARAALEYLPSFLIVDWKTYRRRPSRAWLARRLQTRVYPVVLLQAGASLGNWSQLGNAGRPIKPDVVEMCYWLAEYPEDPESFAYDAATYQADLDYLFALITKIVGRIGGSQSGAESGAISTPDEIWPLTTDVRRCRFCNYRSLCGRGDVAGPMGEYMEEEGGDYLTTGETGLDFDLDWGQVQEIAY